MSESLAIAAAPIAAPATAAPVALRNPYLIGGAARGASFYGRTALIQDLLDDNPRSIWIVGNRRIGKTSLLRRLKELGNTETRVTFYIDMQATETANQLTQCFLDEDNTERLARLGLTAAELSDKQPHEIMRRLDRSAAERGLNVLLLLDEAEALFTIVDSEGDQILKNLQRVMEDTSVLRVILSATKRLLAMDSICKSWDTTRFLDVVTPRYLGRLEQAESLALIRQSQSPTPQPVDDDVAMAILAATGGHPFLTQWLCGSRLWSDGALRRPTAEDLLPSDDINLCRMFEEDYHSLSPNEQRILRAFADVECLDEASALALIKDCQPGQIRSLFSALAQLCYIQRVENGYSIGNEILRSWLKNCSVAELAPAVSDTSAMMNADEEQQAINAQLELHAKRLRLLQAKQALQGISTPPEVAIEIEDIEKQIAGLKGRLGELRGVAYDAALAAPAQGSGPVAAP